MTDATFTGNAATTDAVYFQRWLIEADPGEHVTVRVETTITGTQDAAASHPFGAPSAAARITRVGNTQLGDLVQGGPYRFFDSCPSAWQGFLAGSREVEVTLRTTYATATVKVHLAATQLAVDGVTQDTSRDGQAVVDHQLNPLIHTQK